MRARFSSFSYDLYGKRCDEGKISILADIVPAKHIADDLTVFYPKLGQYRSLNQISPITHVISSTWQNLTGIVRIYTHPAWAEKLASMGDEIDYVLIECCKQSSS